jgi:hypothetical protein
MAEQQVMRAMLPDCEEVVFAGANHDIAYRQAERCAGEALAFIRRHPG